MSLLSTSQWTGQQQSHIEWLSERHGLMPEAKLAWYAMQKAAMRDGLTLDLVSSFRSFAQQLAIWNAKFSGQRVVLDDANQPVALAELSELDKITAILRFSALPGTSRHHWGTDLDLYSASLQTEPLQLVASEYEAGGPQYLITQWIDEHAAEFGFYRPYATDLGGVACEPWHLSYAPLAKQIEPELTVEAVATTLANSDIMGRSTLLNHLETLFERFTLRVAPATI